MGLLSRLADRLSGSPDIEAPPAAGPVDLAANPRAVGHQACLQGLSSRGYEPQCILDVGAAEGLWALAARAAFPKARVFMIEALEERRPVLEELRRRDPALDFEITGAGARNETMTMGMTTRLDGSSFAYHGHAGSREVAVRTLDSLLEEGRLPQPQLMKLDVQGFELEVLEGAATMLARADLVLLEVQFRRFARGMPLLYESIEYMVGRGFRPYEIVDVLRRPLDNAMGQCDLLFCREGHSLLADDRWAKGD